MVLPLEGAKVWFWSGPTSGGDPDRRDQAEDVPRPGSPQSPV